MRRALLITALFLAVPTLGMAQTTLGTGANAISGSVAIGGNASAPASSSVTVGDSSAATGDASSAVGAFAQATGGGASAFGNNAQATAQGASVFGSGSAANGLYSTSVGSNVVTTGKYAVGLGNGARADGDNSLVLGLAQTTAAATGGIAAGTSALVDAADGVAVGTNAAAHAACSAIGLYAQCTENGTASFGYLGAPTRLVNVANGLDPFDAINMGQATQMGAVFGAGAGFVNGVFKSPAYLIQGSIYTDVGSAFAAVDGKLTQLSNNSGGTPGPQGPAGPQGPKGDTGATGPAGSGNGNGTDSKAVHYDSNPDGSVNVAAVTLQGTNGTTVSNVADGQVSAQSMDAVNGRQLFQAQVDARTYTDKGVQQAKDWAKDYTDMRLRDLNARFSTTQAMGAAQASLASQLGALSGQNRIGAAVGFAGGHNGIAVGYQHVNSRGNVAFGLHGSVAGRDRSIGVGVGYSW